VSPPIHPLASSQGAVFLVNSRQGYFRCGPRQKRGQALFRSYGRFFAEFLEEQSLVRRGLLDLTTCVGLRYGSQLVMLRGFSWKRVQQNLPRLPLAFSLSLEYCQPDLPDQPPHCPNAKPLMRSVYNPPSPHRTNRK